MFSPYDHHPIFYDRRRRNLPLDWDYGVHESADPFLSLGREHYEQLLQEAELNRLVRRLPQRPSWASQARPRVQSWLVEVRCRVRNSDLRQPCPEPAA
jgi:hypothetical protein